MIETESAISTNPSIPTGDGLASEQPVENAVTIIPFYGLSCMGKSELVAFLRSYAPKDNVSVFDVSIDAIANPMMKEFKLNNPEVNDEDIYMKIYDKISKRFAEQIFHTLQNLKAGKNILVIDNAMADNEILRKIKGKEDIAPGYRKRIFCLYPKVPQHSLHANLPFSLQLVLNVCHRVVQRKSHETMTYDKEKKLQIVLSFTKLYLGVNSIPDHYKEKTEVDAFHHLEFHQESGKGHQSDQMPDLIIRLYNQIEASLKALGVPFESPFVTGKREVEHLAKLLDELQHLDKSQVQPYINYGRKTEWEEWYRTSLLKDF